MSVGGPIGKVEEQGTDGGGTDYEGVSHAAAVAESLHSNSLKMLPHMLPRSKNGLQPKL